MLDTAIPAHNKEVIALTVDAVGNEWRELGENFPAAKDTSVSGGLHERLKARGAVRELVLTLRQIAMAAEAGDYAQAAQVLADYRQQVAAAAPGLKARRAMVAVQSNGAAGAFCRAQAARRSGEVIEQRRRG